MGAPPPEGIQAGTVDMLARSTSDMRAISLTQPQLVPVLSRSFLGNYWPVADQVYVDDPVPLPATFRAFRHAVFQAELHRRVDAELSATVDASRVFDDDDRTLEGRIAAVRQSVVEPASNSFPVENSLVLETDGQTVTVGGPGAFVEDYEGNEVLLERR